MQRISEIGKRCFSIAAKERQRIYNRIYTINNYKKGFTGLGKKHKYLSRASSRLKTQYQSPETKSTIFMKKLKELKNNRMVLLIGLAAFPISLLCVIYHKFLKEKYIKLREKLGLKVYLKSLLISTFEDQEVLKETIDFVEQIFLAPKTQDAGIKLLLGILSEKEFERELEIFTDKLVSKVFTMPTFQSTLEESLGNILTTPRIQKDAMSLISYIIAQEETTTMLSDLFIQVFEREDLLKVVTDSLANCTYEILGTEESAKIAEKFILKVVNSESLTGGVVQAFSKPLKGFIAQTFTLGLYKQPPVFGGDRDLEEQKEKIPNGTSELHFNQQSAKNTFL